MEFSAVILIIDSQLTYVYFSNPLLLSLVDMREFVGLYGMVRNRDFEELLESIDQGGEECWANQPESSLLTMIQA